MSRNINGPLMTEFKKWRAPKAVGRTAAPRRDRAPKTMWRPWGTRTTTRGRSSGTARSTCWEPPSRPRARCWWCPKGAGPERGAGTDLDLVIYVHHISPREWWHSVMLCDLWIISSMYGKWYSHVYIICDNYADWWWCLIIHYYCDERGGGRTAYIIVLLRRI